MEMIIDDDEIREIKIEDILPKSDDKGKVIVPSVGEGSKSKIDDKVKEIIAIDALTIGNKETGEIHQVAQSQIKRYANGEDIKDEDVRARVLSVKHNIADTAVAKLMETLNLFDPTCLEKQTDIVKSAGMLAGIVEKVTGNEKGKGGNEVHLHLYGPKQNRIDKYEVIDV